MCSVELENSFSSLNSSVRTINLLESFAGPVQNIVYEMTNVSIKLMWMPPAVTNGNILGYSVYVNNFTVSILSVVLVQKEGIVVLHSTLGIQQAMEFCIVFIVTLLLGIRLCITVCRNSIHCE